MSWTHIVVHHSAGHDTDALDTAGIRRFHERDRGWRDIGYHFLVERVGDYYTSVSGRPLTLKGSHEPKANSTGIGVCFVGNFSLHPMPHEQVEAGAQLIAGLVLLLGGAGSEREVAGKIKPHRHYKATECPGKDFPLDTLVRRAWELVRGSEV